MRQYFQTTIINVNVCFDLIGWHAVRCIGMHPNCSWLSMPWNCDRSLSSSNPQSISFTLTVYLNSIIQPIPRSCIGFCPAFLFLNIFHFNQKNVSNSRHWLVVYFTNWMNQWKVCKSKLNYLQHYQLHRIFMVWTGRAMATDEFQWVTLWIQSFHRFWGRLGCERRVCGILWNLKRERESEHEFKLKRFISFIFVCLLAIVFSTFARSPSISLSHSSALFLSLAR